MSLTDTSLSHIIVVGGGFGGLRCAKALKDAPARITLIDRSNHHLFQPLLYQVATAGLSPADIASPIRSLLRDQQNTKVLMAEVKGIETKLKQVILENVSLVYDYLVLATGARHSYFGKEEWKKYAPGLKSITDATAIRQKILLAFEAAEMETDAEKIKALLHFILVGAGPTGVEMAGAIAELAHLALQSDFRNIDPRSAKVTLVEAGPHILTSFSSALSLKAHRALEKLGVEVLLNTRVENIDAEGITVKGKHIPSKSIIWAAGVEASPAGKWLKVETDRMGRVKVLPNLSVPSFPEVFVIGDTAFFEQGGKPLPGLAPVAMQEGEYVGALIQSRLIGSPLTQNFHYKDKGNLATVGRGFAIADMGKIKLTGIFGWMAWLAVHIYFLIGFRNRLLVLMEWAWAYCTFQRGARLIVSDDHLKEQESLPDHQ